MKLSFQKAGGLLLAIFIGSSAFAPMLTDCIPFKKGETIKSKSLLYANPLPLTNKKWAKLKQDKRDELIAAQNASIASGSIAPWRTTDSEFLVTDVTHGDAVSSFTLKAVNSGFEYQTTNYCMNDTMHLIRNKDVVWSVLNGDTLGLAMQGAQLVPNKLKVGDRLPSYQDFMITIPKTWTSTVTESVKAYSYTTTSNKVGWMQDSYSGQYSYGKFRVTETQDVYKNISHKVDITEHIENLSINYYAAIVTAQEEITVGGKSYTAFKIESESWSKAGVVRDYAAENARIEGEQEAAFTKLKAKMERKQLKAGYINDQGYSVTYKTEWFVPGYGMVKAETYDQFGAIQSHSISIFP